MTDFPNAGVGLLLDVNPVVGPQKAGGRRFWTNREIAILRAHYPAGGVEGCLQLLPGRTARSIYARAGAMGLKRVGADGKTGRERRKWVATPAIDEAIRRAVAENRPLRSLSAVLGWPGQRLAIRSQELGLKPPRGKQPDWSAGDIAVLEAHPGAHPSKIRTELIKAGGVARTLSAIVQKRRDLALAPYREGGSEVLNGVAVAEAFGVSVDQVRRWVKRGLLPERRNHSLLRSVDAKPHPKAGLRFSRRVLRTFVIEHVAAIDFRKVDKFWLVDLIASPIQG